MYTEDEIIQMKVTADQQAWEAWEDLNAWADSRENWQYHDMLRRVAEFAKENYSDLQPVRKLEDLSENLFNHVRNIFPNVVDVKITLKPDGNFISMTTKDVSGAKLNYTALDFFDIKTKVEKEKFTLLK